MCDGAMSKMGKAKGLVKTSILSCFCFNLIAKQSYNYVHGKN